MLAGKRRDGKGHFSRAIIPPSLDMAVIGEVNAGRCTPRAIGSGLLHRLLDAFLIMKETTLKPATVTATILLAVVSLAQLLRAVLGVRVIVGDTVIPIWVSGVAFVVAGGLAFMLWRESRRNG